MNKFLVISAIVFTFMIAFVSAQSCYVSPSLNTPIQPDSDCDEVIDRLDNCVFVSNPLQQDSDDNGQGDACDVSITSIGTSPSNYVYTSRAFNVNVNLDNNREYAIRNVRINVRMPDLGIEAVEQVDSMESCTSQNIEVTLRAPLCSNRSTQKVISEITFMNAYGIYEKTWALTSINIEPDPECAMMLQSNHTFGNTFIEVMEIQDVYKGSEAVFPIKISNMEAKGKEYILQVTGLDGWGNARINTGSVIIVPRGTEKVADLYVSALDDVAPGERVFVLTIKSGEEYERMLLIANVKEKPYEDMGAYWAFALRVLLAAFIALLLLLAIFIGIRKYVVRAKQEPINQYY